MNLNLKVDKTHRYDAIVVGSGMTGGMAAKELTEKGLQVLMIERGREVKHIEDYDTAMKGPWEFQHRGKISIHSAEEYWANSRFGNLANEETGEFFTDDKKNPYIEKRPFDWIRAYHTGGKSMHWGRQSYRFNKNDFEANAKEGIAIDWPIRYEDLEPWYTHVEKFVGISGQKENLEVLPDGHFLPAMPMSAPELYFQRADDEKAQPAYHHWSGSESYQTSAMAYGTGKSFLSIPQQMQQRLSLWRILQLPFRVNPGGKKNGKTDHFA